MFGDVELAVEISVLEKTPNRLKIHVKNVPLHILNAIRRAAISEVPTMAIDVVVFTVNSSVFYDEIVAHRLGLIPLTSEAALEKYKSPEECREASEGAIFTEECFAKFDLIAKNPVESGKPLIVYSRDLKVSDPDVRPVYDSIPILILGPGQEIRLEAYARLGRGREHAKWSPVSVAAHKYVPEIKVDKEKCVADCRKCVEACPKNILEKVDGVLVVKEDKLFDCTLCRMCMTSCPQGAIHVGYRENEYILTIESTGALPPKRILLEAVKIIESKLDEFLNKLREQGVVK